LTCQWCKAKARCPSLLEQVQETIASDFDDLNEIKLPVMTNNELGNLYPKLELIEYWIAAVRDIIKYELSEGREVDGLKLVKGRKSNRTWISDEEVEKILLGLGVQEDEIYSKKLLTPKAMLEKYKEYPDILDVLEKHVIQKEGEPIVTLSIDKRCKTGIKGTDLGFEIGEQ
jgi:hypothetical protein